jgi:hypothetical protein
MVWGVIEGELVSSSGIPPDQDPLHSRYRVEEIERLRWEQEKKQKQETFPEPPAQEKLGLSGLIILLFMKIFDFLKGAAKQGLFSTLDEKARANLLLLKKSFELMMQLDMSQDVPFLRRLSKIWQNALEENLELDSLELRHLIRDIETHPEGEDHTFGYYLTEYAGQKWLPFPYMELIRELHRQHELDPASSLLTRWHSRLEEILNRP